MPRNEHPRLPLALDSHSMGSDKPCAHEGAASGGQTGHVREVKS